jgi:hypothetical protein
MTSPVSYVSQVEQAPVANRFRRLMGQSIRLAGILIISTAAFAQYGAGGIGTTTSAPSYGHAKAIGIGAGAAAAGVGAFYLMTHRGSKVSGCVEPADDGLHLSDDKTKRTLALVPGNADIKAGERVELKGKIKKNAGGNESFLVKTVAKDFGPCQAAASGGGTNRLNSQAQ